MNFIKNIFVSSESRLRTGWRIGLQIFAFFFFLSFAQVFQLLGYRYQSFLLLLLAIPVDLVGLGIMLFVFSRWVDRRPMAGYGFHLNRRWWLDAGVGALLGAFTLSAVFFIEKTAGWLTVASTVHTVFDVPFVLVALVIFLVLAVFAAGEELAFRGFLLRNLAEGFGRGKRSTGAVVIALILSSAIFGLAHGGNPNASLTSTVNIVLAGMLLGWGYVLTGELALPIGLHIAWNFFEEFVYGFPNSGMAPANWLLGSVVNGPALWTGGDFGPEAGLLVTILILIDAGLIALWATRRRGGASSWGEMAEYRRNSHPG